MFKCNQECFAQGLANFIASLFGGMGGDAMIGQSTINILNGARGRVSGKGHALAPAGAGCALVDTDAFQVWLLVGACS